VIPTSEVTPAFDEANQAERAKLAAACREIQTLVSHNGRSPIEIHRLGNECWTKAAPVAADGLVLVPLDWPTLLRDGVPPVEYIAEPYFPKGARIWVWGATGTAKSLYCLWQATRLSREGVRVAYFSEENTIQEDLRRLSKLEPDAEHFRMFHRTGMDLADANWIAAMLVATAGDDLVFLDSWTDLWSGDENENRDVQRFDATVLKPLQAQGATPVVIHHTGHRQMFSDRAGATAGRGASALGQKADVVLEFKDAGEGRFTIVYGKCRIGGIRQPQRCFIVQDTDDGRVDVTPAESPEELAVLQLADKMVGAILTSSEHQLTTNKLRLMVGGRREHQTAAMALLEVDSRVRCDIAKVQTADGKRRNAKVWRSADGNPLGERFDILADGGDEV